MHIKKIKCSNFKELYFRLEYLAKHGSIIKNTHESFNIIAEVKSQNDQTALSQLEHLIHTDPVDDEERKNIIKQMHEAINEFKIDNTYTRRAVYCHLYECDTKYLPRCISLLQFYYRQNKLHMNVYFRSSDIKRLPYDLYTLNNFLSIASKELNMRMGKIFIWFASCHEYLK